MCYEFQKVVTVQQRLVAVGNTPSSGALIDADAAECHRMQDQEALEFYVTRIAPQKLRYAHARGEVLSAPHKKEQPTEHS
jgi:hypothetical protein